MDYQSENPFIISKTNAKTSNPINEAEKKLSPFFSKLANTIERRNSQQNRSSKTSKEDKNDKNDKNLKKPLQSKVSTILGLNLNDLNRDSLLLTDALYSSNTGINEFQTNNNIMNISNVSNSYKTEDKSKFFIKTRTAALGVRGTEFQTMYQPDAMRTGLLTFKGEVAIKKIEPGELAKKVEVVGEKRVQAFREALDVGVKEVKVAKLGDYTNLSALDNAPSAPVKIDPTQLTLLK